MTRKIAPYLTSILGDAGASRGSPTSCKAARAELRALLAVARAAQPLLDHYFPAISGAAEWHRLDRALARLSRAEERGKEKS